MENRHTRSSCGPSCADPEQQHIRPFRQNTNDQVENTSVAIVTSQKLFSSLRCLKEATMFVWKSFQRRQNCWSSAMVEWDGSICNKDQHLLFGHGTARTSCVPRFWFFSTDRYENFTPFQNLIGWNGVRWTHERDSNIMHICGTGYRSRAQFCQPPFSGEQQNFKFVFLQCPPGRIYRYQIYQIGYTTFYVFICWLQVSGTKRTI